MSTNSISPLKFWIRTNQPLESIGDALCACNVIPSYERDCENVYEWFTCTPIGFEVELNVSRKHYDGDVDSDEPLRFLVIGRKEAYPDESIVRKLAAKVHAALGEAVFVGAINYLDGDDFRYIPECVLKT